MKNIFHYIEVGFIIFLMAAIFGAIFKYGYLFIGHRFFNIDFTSDHFVYISDIFFTVGFFLFIIIMIWAKISLRKENHD